MNSTDARALFGRHLDLSPLRGRRRGVVACIFHKDRTPSLSVDLDRALFNCFSCGAQGGLRRFRELVGEEWRPVNPNHVSESEAARARRIVLVDERRRRARLAEWSHLLRAMAWLRTQERAIAAVRATATDDDDGWAALHDAAVLEAYVEAKTVEIESLLEEGRVA
jgi:CHC2 zinc finger